MGMYVSTLATFLYDSKACGLTEPRACFPRPFALSLRHLQCSERYFKNSEESK